MTAFDIIVFFLIGSGAVFGLFRGFVQDTLSMISWILVIAAVNHWFGNKRGYCGFSRDCYRYLCTW
ncbi:MAG: hypothetical protein RLZZ191_1712 [Pseudomonadota bacterium]